MKDVKAIEIITTTTTKIRVKDKRSPHATYYFKRDGDSLIINFGEDYYTTSSVTLTSNEALELADSIKNLFTRIAPVQGFDNIQQGDDVTCAGAV